jgi:D-glucuronyl C5-epimerase C-terminus
MRVRRGFRYVFVAVLCSLCAAPDAHAAARKTVKSELKRFDAAGTITPEAYQAGLDAYADARARVKKLSGARRLELSGVIRDLESMAARGQLSPSRTAPLFLTLERNTEYWTTQPLIDNGARVTFPPSQIIWQLYAGHGIQIQWLGTFGTLNALYKGGRKNDAKTSALLSEVLPLASERAGGLAWEYLFPFDGQYPPWVSSLAQGTGLQAMARAAARLGRQPEVMPVLHAGLGIFATSPPQGVRVPDAGGAHYLQYSGLAGVKIINGFIQSLVGLYDYATLSGDPLGQSLFQAGDTAGRAEIAAFDTGAWSLYARGSSSYESDLGYHVLLRDFLDQLCARTAAIEYCGAAQRFTAYLSEPPAIQVLPATVRPNHTGRLRFTLSKVSRVTVSVARGTKPVSTISLGTIGHGRRTVTWKAPKRTGDYTVSVSATDLAGNQGGASGDVLVAKDG